MTRRAIIRATLAAGLLVGAVGPVGQAAAAVEAPPATPGPHTVFQSDRYVPRGGALRVAGPNGVLRREEGTSAFLWTSFADGRTTPVSGSMNDMGHPGALGAGSDTVAVVKAGSVQLHNKTDGTVRTVTHPTSRRYLGTYGETVLTYEPGTHGSVTLPQLHHVADDGTATTRDVTGLGVDDVPYRVPLAGDARTVVLRYRDTAAEPDQERLGLLDIATARFEPGPAIPPGPQTAVALGETRLAWYTPGQPVRVVPRSAPASAPVAVPLPSGQGTVSLGLVGDWVVVARHYASSSIDPVDRAGMPLVAVPIGGGAPVTLLRHADSELLQVPGGDLLVTGGTDSAHWAVRRVTAPAGGAAPTPTAVAAIEPVAAKIRRLSLAGGTLATDEPDSGAYGGYFTRRVTTEGARLSVGPGTWAGWTGEGGPWSAGDGRVVKRAGDTVGDIGLKSLDADDPAGYFRTPSKDARVVEVTGRYAILNGPDTGKQYIGDLGVHTDLEPILTRATPAAASVWGSTLWTQGPKAGWVESHDLKGGSPSRLGTGAPCVATDLQAVGRWLYWSCGAQGPAGVWDRTAKKNIPVPSGEALIGDGYLVRHDKTAGQLVLTEFRDGTADTSQPVGDLPATAQRGVTWTVDRFGGPVAYVARDGKVHLVPSGVATEPMAVVESTVRSLPDRQGWHGRFHLSRPAVTWQLRFKSADGKVVRTLTGSGQNGLVEVDWDGTTDQGRHTANGSHTWVLTAQPANGQGPAAVRSGSAHVDFGAPAHRDLGGPGGAVDGRPDLLSLGAKGDLATHYATGTGGYSGGTAGTGWPTTALAVPMGDMNGDRCNDVLVRLGGELRLYKPWCGTALTPGTPHTRLGTVWAQFNVLTSPGDLTGDGRADLVARQASTGDMYLYADDGAGKLKARGRIATNWKAYRAVFGAGDLNGDGVGDLLAVDGANALWRYDGTSAGTVKARALVFGNNWGRGRNAFVGAGDLNRDGKADLISRNAAGDLLRNNGNGAGSFGSTAKIAAGWQARVRLF